MSSVMAHDENPNRISDDAKQKMIWKALKVDSPNVTLSDRK